MKPINQKKEQSLIETHPELVKEWHPTKNGELMPQVLTAGSHKKIWWCCSHGHEWESMVRNRAKGSGCPYCTSKRVLHGFNDLETTHPQLIKEWHPILNEDLTPQHVTPYSNKKVWWKCSEGHEWASQIATRTSKGSGCPHCSRIESIKGKSNLAATHPELIKEWHPTLNGDLTPQAISAGSGKKVWWKCKKGHEWETVLFQRTSSNQCGCPYCSGRYSIPGETDLATTYPELAKQWHPTLNGELKAQDVLPSSNKKVWWKCTHGHEWSASVANRTKGKGCPYCSGIYAIKGENDLSTTHPELANEWHPTLNKELTPRDVVAGSSKKTWWQCSHGHIWQSRVVDRKNGNNCPSCTAQNY